MILIWAIIAMSRWAVEMPSVDLILKIEMATRGVCSDKRSICLRSSKCYNICPWAIYSRDIVPLSTNSAMFKVAPNQSALPFPRTGCTHLRNIGGFMPARSKEEYVQFRLRGLCGSASELSQRCRWYIILASTTHYQQSLVRFLLYVQTQAQKA